MGLRLLPGHSRGLGRGEGELAQPEGRAKERLSQRRLLGRQLVEHLQSEPAARGGSARRGLGAQPHSRARILQQLAQRRAAAAAHAAAGTARGHGRRHLPLRV
eukprot:3755299-Prymnesium_polylepis.1